MPTRLLIAAHIRVYREGLADILAREAGIEVVATSKDWRDTFEQVRALQPDIVLLDPALSDGMQIIRDLVDGAMRVEVVAFAAPVTESAVAECAEAGVSGYVTHDDSFGDLLATIRSVARGEPLCSPRAAGALLRRLRALAQAQSLGFPEMRLTRREHEVIGLIDEGLSNKQIARRLCIELPTVKNHVHHILGKLDATRRTEAVARMRHIGRLQPPRQARSLRK